MTASQHLVAAFGVTHRLDAHTYINERYSAYCDFDLRNIVKYVRQKPCGIPHIIQ